MCRGSRPGRVDGRRWRSYPFPRGSRRRGTTSGEVLSGVPVEGVVLFGSYCTTFGHVTAKRCRQRSGRVYTERAAYEVVAMASELVDFVNDDWRVCKDPEHPGFRCSGVGLQREPGLAGARSHGRRSRHPSPRGWTRPDRHTCRV